MTRDMARANQQKEEAMLYSEGKDREKKMADSRYSEELALVGIDWLLILY